jgi:hypothetical protein
MIVTFLDPDISTWISPRVIPERTPGPHVSAVLVSMLKTAMPRQFEKWGKTEDGARLPVFEPGYLWEDVLAAALAARAHLEPQQRLMPAQEISRNGIYGTPDRVLYDSTRDGWIVEELKATWYSNGGLETNPEAIMDNRKFTYWTLQAKTYAAMLLHHVPHRYRGDGYEDDRDMIVPTDPATEGRFSLSVPPIARIRALFVNGNYKRGGPDDNRAQPMCWQIEWTPEELTAWWNNVVDHARTLTPGEPE